MFSRVGRVIQFRKIMTTAKFNLNHYEVLGVDPTATAAEIKMAYFEKTKLYHPDKASASEENLRNFRLISEAYEILGNESLRKHYNENVLGLTSENDKKEYSFNKYNATRMADDVKLDEWTKNHLKFLRRDNFQGKQQSPVVTKKSILGPLIIYTIIFGILLISFLTENDKKSLTSV